MTNPQQARATDQGRYYEDPQGGPDLISVTNVLDHSVGKPILIPWASKVVANYVLGNLPRVVSQARKDPEGILKEIKQQPALMRDAAADRGSRVHNRAEAHLLRAPVPDEEDPEVTPYFNQFLKFLDAWGIDPDRDLEAAEATVAHRGLGYAGTMDMLLHLPTGATRKRRRQLWLIDIKTSETQASTTVWPEYDMQLAAYRYAPVIWAPDGTDIPMPKVAGAAILNLRRRRVNLVPMQANRASFAAFRSALTVAKHLQHIDKTKFIPLTPPTDLNPTTLRRAA
ncbi:hypothetical protein [Streptomyces sp. NBRC 110465]|uniref:hypothetical protein n=1 Tax=Streptomyces sp. NBRC 110465 TaxID=1897621 RepID=UPI000932E7C1|nr:hypothetical protein [Streptomyces sp. NBRC 110465]